MLQCILFYDFLLIRFLIVEKYFYYQGYLVLAILGYKYLSLLFTATIKIKNMICKGYGIIVDLNKNGMLEMKGFQNLKIGIVPFS